MNDDIENLRKRFKKDDEPSKLKAFLLALLMLPYAVTMEIVFRKLFGEDASTSLFIVYAIITSIIFLGFIAGTIYFFDGLKSKRHMAELWVLIENQESSEQKVILGRVLGDMDEDKAKEFMCKEG